MLREIYSVRLRYNGTEARLEVLPDGLENFDYRLVRSAVYHSIMERFSFPLGFIYDGQSFVEEAYAQEGPAAVVEIFIDLINEETLAYEPFIRGTLDMYQRKKLRDVTELPVINNSKNAKLMERDEIAYDLLSTTSADDEVLPEIGNTPKSVTFTAVKPVLWAEFDVAVDSVYTKTSTPPIDLYKAVGYTHRGSLPFNLLPSVDPNPVATTAVAISDISVTPIYTNTSDVAKTIKIDIIIETLIKVQFIYFEVVGETNIRLGWRLRYKDALGEVIGSKIVYVEYTRWLGNSRYTYTNTSTLSEEVSIPSGGWVESFGYYDLAPFINGELINPDDYRLWYSDIVLSHQFPRYVIREEQSETPDGQCDTVLAFEALSKLIQIGSSETSTTKVLDSALLGRIDSSFSTYIPDGRLGLLAFTNGFRLRGQAKPINVSLRTLFKALDAVGNVGLWYNSARDIYELKPKADYYRRDKVLILEDVERLEITVDTSRLYNEVKGGYAVDNTYEEINGVLEFNRRATYGTPAAIKRSLNIESPIGADTLGITQARAKAFNAQQDSNDESSDNELFMVCLRRQQLGSPIMRTETGADLYKAEGIVSGEQFYNYRITPKRNLLVNSDRVSPSFWRQIDKKISVVSTRNAVDVEVKPSLFPSTIDPIASVESNELATEVVNPGAGTSKVLAPLHGVETYTLSAPVPTPLFKELLADPHVTIQFEYDGETYEGFIEELSLNNSEKKANIKLISKI